MPFASPQRKWRTSCWYMTKHWHRPNAQPRIDSFDLQSVATRGSRRRSLPHTAPDRHLAVISGAFLIYFRAIGESDGAPHSGDRLTAPGPLAETTTYSARHLPAAPALVAPVTQVHTPSPQAKLESPWRVQIRCASSLSFSPSQLHPHSRPLPRPLPGTPCLLVLLSFVHADCRLHYKADDTQCSHKWYQSAPHPHYSSAILGHT